MWRGAVKDFSDLDSLNSGSLASLALAMREVQSDGEGGTNSSQFVNVFLV